jgi:hypothetical protein
MQASLPNLRLLSELRGLLLAVFAKPGHRLELSYAEARLFDQSILT